MNTKVPGRVFSSRTAVEGRAGTPHSTDHHVPLGDVVVRGVRGVALGVVVRGVRGVAGLLLGGMGVRDGEEEQSVFLSSDNSCTCES